jgi:hypothetical protein
MIVYSIDTSTMIDAGERYYPIDIFPGFWERLDGLVDAGRLKAPATLIDELKEKDDEWREWVYERKEKMIWEIDEQIQHAMSNTVMPAFAAATTNLGSITLDPFFIASALVKGATLITSEKPRKGAIKIPKICDSLSVPWSPLLEVVRTEGWKF